MSTGISSNEAHRTDNKMNPAGRIKNEFRFRNVFPPFLFPAFHVLILSFAAGRSIPAVGKEIIVPVLAGA
jgi:hypothetical protein